MLKQFASLKNCRCTWQLTWQIYFYEAAYNWDQQEHKHNMLRFWKYTDMIWYALQWWTMFLWRLAVAPKICWSAWICMKTNELSNDRALANWKELGVCSKTRWSMMVNQFEDVNSLSRVAAVASVCFVPPDGRQGSFQFMRSFEHSASLSSTKSKV